MRTDSHLFLLSQFDQFGLEKKFSLIKPNLSTVDVIYPRMHSGVLTFLVLSSRALWQPAGPFCLPSHSDKQQSRRERHLISRRGKKKSHYSGKSCGSEINSAVCNSTSYYSGKNEIFEPQLIKRFLLTVNGSRSGLGKWET